MGHVRHLAAVGLLALGTGLGQASAPPAPLAPGQWAGSGVVLVVTREGGRIEFPCASVEIKRPIRPDADGRFAVEAAYRAEGPGPVRENEPTIAARVEGRVEGDSMTGELVLPSRKDSFSVTLGKKTRLIKCK